MTESLLLLLALAAIGAAAWFAYRSAGTEPIRAERDRAMAELSVLRLENIRLATALATEKGAGAARTEAMEQQFVALASQALDANRQSFLALANETFSKHSQAAQGGVKEVLAPAQEQLLKLASSVEALEKSGELALLLLRKTAIAHQCLNQCDAFIERLFLDLCKLAWLYS